MKLLFLIIFGSSMFSGSPVEPSSYQDVPADYVLGRGDSVAVDLFGSSQMQLSQRVKSDGKITMPVIGPVSLQGMPIPQATRRLQSVVASRFAGSEVSLTLVEPRLIEVTVRGEVQRPGKYLVHGYSTLLYVLHTAGGITEDGTMRAIRLQSGSTQTELDLYDNLLGNDNAVDPHLKDGDVIFVPAVKKHVQLDGLIKRAATYELHENQTLGDLLGYAGGITDQDVRIRIRHRGAESNRIETIDIEQAKGYIPADGDVMSVEKIPDSPDNVVQVFGNVQYSGKYLLSEQFRSLSQALRIATPYVTEKPNVVVVYRDTNLIQIGDDELQLRGREKIYVTKRTMVVAGEVLYPTEVDYEPEHTIRQYIDRAGGFTRHGSRNKVYVVTPDGRVIRNLKNIKLVPGSQIVVPKR